MASKERRRFGSALRHHLPPPNSSLFGGFFLSSVRLPSKDCGLARPLADFAAELADHQKTAFFSLRTVPRSVADPSAFSKSASCETETYINQQLTCGLINRVFSVIW